MEDRMEYGAPRTAADRMRSALENLGLSQRAAARELGVDERTMRYWCSGQHDPPAMAFMALEHLADVRRGLRPALAWAKPLKARFQGGGEKLRSVTIARFLDEAEGYLAIAERSAASELEAGLVNFSEADKALSKAQQAVTLIDMLRPAEAEKLRTRSVELQRRAAKLLEQYGQ